MQKQLDIFHNDFDELHKKLAEMDFSNLSETEKKDFFKKISLETAAIAFNKLKEKNARVSTWDVKRVMDTISESIKVVNMLDNIKTDDDDVPVITVTVRRE